MIEHKNYLKLVYRYYILRRFSEKETVEAVNTLYPEKSKYRIRCDIKKYFPRDNPNHFTEQEKSLLFRVYSSIDNLPKAIDYLKSKNLIHRDITEQQLSQLAAKHNIRRKSDVARFRFVTFQERKKIAQLYDEGISVTQLMDMYGYKTPKSITDIVKKENLNLIRHGSDAYHRNKEVIDFEFIDTPFKAYYLGLLLTDGYLTSGKTDVSIQMTDYDVIEFIANQTRSNITTINSKTHSTTYRTSIYHSKYRNQLKRLGVIEKKSLVLYGPMLYDFEKHYIPYIFRGIIDGDGWIRKDGKEFFICSASQQFIIWCYVELTNLGMVDLNVNFSSSEQYSGIYCLRSGLIENINILKQLIYDIPYGMSRKYDLLHGGSETVIEASEQHSDDGTVQTTTLL